VHLVGFIVKNNYLFETCRGYFDRNKLVRESVDLDGLSHVYSDIEWFRCTCLKLPDDVLCSDKLGLKFYNALCYGKKTNIRTVSIKSLPNLSQP
jgi:hypothetical protein